VSRLDEPRRDLRQSAPEQLMRFAKPHTCSPTIAIVVRGVARGGGTSMR
jgi:hypothetical protein